MDLPSSHATSAVASKPKGRIIKVRKDLPMVGGTNDLSACIRIESIFNFCHKTRIFVCKRNEIDNAAACKYHQTSIHLHGLLINDDGFNFSCILSSEIGGCMSD